MQVEFGLVVVQQLKRTGKHRKLHGGSALLYRINLYQLMRRSWQHAMHPGSRPALRRGTLRVIVNDGLGKRVPKYVSNRHNIICRLHASVKVRVGKIQLRVSLIIIFLLLASIFSLFLLYFAADCACNCPLSLTVTNRF